MCPSRCRPLSAPILLACLILFGAGGASGQRLIILPRVDSSLASSGALFPHFELQRPRVALVLSGGGARGIAQIGVLKALEEYGIPVDFIVGTSMGAIIGGLYAAGESPRELDSLALATNWDDVLALDDDTKRRDLFVDQKAADDRSFLAVRFQGIDPVIPSSVSSGQRLTDFLSMQVLRAPYHPYQNFDQMKIPFRAVATDLVSGERVVMRDGSFAQALRASATIPLVFSPIERGGMRLIDGGLTANIPVDVAREAGYDVVIVVNSTSGLRSEDELKAPWQTADQIMGIMMGLLNEEQLRNADVVITPALGRHVGSNFHGLDSLIHSGYIAGVQAMPAIIRLIEQRGRETYGDGEPTLSSRRVDVSFEGYPLPDSLKSAIEREARSGSLNPGRIQHHLEDAYKNGGYRDVSAVLLEDSVAASALFTFHANPVIASIAIEGCSALKEDSLRGLISGLIGKPANHRTLNQARERLIRAYRSGGFALAGVDSIDLDAGSGRLRVRINEGVIHRLEVQGGVRSQDRFILLEFPLQEGDVFQIDRAQRGIANLNGTTLFEYVYLEVTYEGRLPLLTIRLRERPSQLVRFGLRGDDERNLQGLVDLRDVNFRGTGTELGLMIAGGQRNADFSLEYKSRRLLDSYVTFNVNGFYRTLDSYLYADAPPEEENHWKRIVAGEYRDIRYGAGIALGSQLERLGNFNVELLYQDVRIKSLDRAAQLEERYRLGMLKVGTVVDTKDVYPFTTAGIGLDLSYEFAFESLGGDIGYNSLRLMYESYSSWSDRITFHPKFTFGFADRTMPLSQQFRLGGRDSFFGVREDDRRGRQLLLVNVEYRYFLPFRILFDAYLRVRYDLGTISAVPEEIKFNTLRHGVGAELALRTPLGPAAIGLGKSFYFGKDLPNNPVQQGPLLVYFMIGYQM